MAPRLRSPRHTLQQLWRRLREGARAAFVTTLAGTVAACASGDDPGSRGSKSASAIGARLGPIAGSIGHGLVVFRPYDGGLSLVVEVGGFNRGTYRLVIHATPVCTSPNGFSAGPPFVLPATGAPVVVAMTIDTQGTASMVTRVPGLALSGPASIEGRSVVLHAGQSGPLEAAPGIPNDRVACGAIGPIPSLF